MAGHRGRRAGEVTSRSEAQVTIDLTSHAPGAGDMDVDTDVAAQAPATDQPHKAAASRGPYVQSKILGSLGGAAAQQLTSAGAMQQEAPAQQAAPPAPLTDAQHAIDYLTHRCVSCRGPAVDSMVLRPALQQLADQLTAALQGMVRDGTSLSALVLGDPGSGKTLLVERAVSSVCAAHNQPGCARVVGVVRLSGLLHTDERATFQDIARQLCSEFGQEFSKSATFEENLAFLRTMLATLHVHCKAVVFLLDAFERFARARGKQQLLYNLLDVLQHAQVQAAVIGMTCVQDVMESMEKRVRSRFSHRRMVVTGLTHFEVPKPVPAAAPAAASSARRGPSAAADQDAPITYEGTPCGVLQAMLSLPDPASSTAAAGSSSSSVGGEATAALQVPGCIPAYVQQHNRSLAQAVQDPQVKAELRKLFVCGIQPRTMAAVARGALDAWEQACCLTSSSPAARGAGASAQQAAHPGLGPLHLLVGITAQLPQPMVQGLCDLSVLQLYLVVGMARLEAKGQTVYNFEMVWDECQSYRADRGVLSTFTHDAAWRAFEDLVAHNVAYWISAGAEASGRAMRYAGATLSVGLSDVRAALTQHETCPNDLVKFMNLEA